MKVLLNALKATIKATPVSFANFVLVVGLMVWGVKVLFVHYITNQPITATKCVVMAALAILVTIVDIASSLKGE